MPRYHFNVFDGFTLIDEEGAELAGLPEARRVALKTAGRVLEGEADRPTAGDDWRMEVTDDSGLVLFMLNFTLTGSPALLKDSPDHMVRP